MKLDPIKPFEPVFSEEIPIGNEWISQIKWDGVRVLTYYASHQAKLYNRKLNERTDIFPELTHIKSYCSAQSVILDGEVIALDNHGQPSFHEVMKRDGIKRLQRVQEVSEKVPIYYMIFDVIFYNGKWINHYPLKDRFEVLHHIVEPNEKIQIVPVHEDGVALFEVVKHHHLEGIVCKNLSSKYSINGKNSSWKKIKNYKDLIAVVGGVTFRLGTVNSMLIGLFDDQGKFQYIGHVGTGKLTKADWLTFTHAIEPIKQDQMPFYNTPERVKDVQWLRPLIPVKDQYIEWPIGHSLRQPSIQAFVTQDTETCTFNQ